MPNYEKQSLFYVNSDYPDCQGMSSIFHKECEKISTLKPLTVWIFAARISPPKTGDRIWQPCPCFRQLHSNDKTVCTTPAAVGRFCGGSVPRPDLSQGTEWNICVNNSKKHLTKRFMVWWMFQAVLVQSTSWSSVEKTCAPIDDLL